MLRLAGSVVSENSSARTGKQVRNIHGERPLEIDLLVDRALVDYMQQHLSDYAVYTEESGLHPTNAPPRGLIVVDPLDGSMNFRAGRGRLPYGTIVTVYSSFPAEIGLVAAAGLIEHTTNSAWIFDGEVTRVLGSRVPLALETVDDGYQIPIFIDLYDEQDYLVFRKLPKDYYVRSTGCAAGNLAYLLMGITSCMGGMCFKPEEIGAVNALVIGAGGALLDFSGDRLEDLSLDFSRRYAAVGGQERVVKEVLAASGGL